MREERREREGGREGGREGTRARVKEETHPYYVCPPYFFTCENIHTVQPIKCMIIRTCTNKKRYRSSSKDVDGKSRDMLFMLR